MAKRKTASKKKTPSRGSKKTAKKPAKKAGAAARKKTTKKASKKPGPARKKPVKKAGESSAKKATKKAASAKKAGKKKPAKKTAKPSAKKASKSTTKKTKKTAARGVAKKPTRKKATGSKKAPAKKGGSSKKEPAKSAGKMSAEELKAERETRGAQLKAAQDAASKLAALAGLPAVSSGSAAAAAPESKRRRLTKSPISPANMQKYKALLYEKRAEVVKDLEAIEGEALNPSRSGSLSTLPQHMADQGSDEFDQTLSLGIAASQRTLLSEIDAALDRMDAGVYGICEMTGGAIQKARLEATPWCRYSLEGARMADLGQTP